MIERLQIRAGVTGDLTAIERIYREAFPDEDLLPLVAALLREPGVALSLVGVIDETVVAHIVFTTCSVGPDAAEAALLGPLAVRPAFHRKGIGGAMVRAGLQHQDDAGVALVCVLGDPGYYGRLGFRPEADIAPPYPLPDVWQGAWQSVRFARAGALQAATLNVPPPWRRPDLWMP